MIIALAGRCVDSTDAKEARFPLANVEAVRTRIRAVLEGMGATALLSSAACGADLIALSEAGRLGLRRRVILPFEPARFRETSVTDRPGEWAQLYDQVLDAAGAAGDLIVLQGTDAVAKSDVATDDDLYAAVNRAILDEAVTLAEAVHESVTVVVAWEGVSRGDRDLTEEFVVEARRRGLAVTEVPTV